MFQREGGLTGSWENDWEMKHKKPLAYSVLLRISRSMA